MKNYEMKAIGTARRGIDCLIIELVEERLIAALKNLSLFSHATFIFSDGHGQLCVRVCRMLEVDEKKGIIVLPEACGVLEGNQIYDIKPYMPCEDRLLIEQKEVVAQPDTAEKAGGIEQLLLPNGGIIRKKQGHYYLYPKNFEGFLSVIGDDEYVKLLWWFSGFDKKEYRRIVQGEPPYENAPRSGIFASRSPVRPNPIALTVVQVLGVDKKEQFIEVAGLDCFDDTPLIDVRAYVPSVDAIADYSVPSWLAHWPEYKEMELEERNEKLTLDDSEEAQLTSFLKEEKPVRSFEFFKEMPVENRQSDAIVIDGARQNNLKNIHAVIPKGKLIAVAGVSGSGKSSLAFDTLYAESRLRFSETADSGERPDVDTIIGLPPAVAIAQRAIGRNPRATVGTFTHIQDRLRLLYTTIGHRHCPKCGKTVRPKSQDELAELLHQLAVKQELKLLSYKDKEIIFQSHKGQSVRWERYVAQALDRGKGAFYLSIDGGSPILLQNREMCYHCQTILFEITPALFSFNNPESMCSICNGLGKTIAIDPARVVARPERSLLDGASDYWGDVRAFREKPTANWMRGELLALAELRDINLELPWNELPEDFRQTALYGSGELEVSWRYVHPKNGRSGTITRAVEGAIPVLNRLLKKGGAAAAQITEEYMEAVECPNCEGERLAREGRMVTIAGLRYPQTTALTIEELLDWAVNLPNQLTVHEQELSRSLLQEIYQQAVRLKKIGLPYLSLNRGLPTLSGGELQRLKLVAQLGIGLSGLLYIMDEPTAGLHPRDYSNILHILNELKTAGNTVMVVEHEEAILRQVDWLLEIGPKAGQHGGEIIWQGEPKNLITAETQTAQFLTGRQKIQIEQTKITEKTSWVHVQGAKGNNLKKLDIRFPKGQITCLTGVSGSGKSTLAEKVLVPAIEASNKSQSVHHYCSSIEGAKDMKHVIHASQTPLSGNRRSVLATFMGLLDELRPLFAGLPQAKTEKLSSSFFSFNNKEGQCDACKGEGIQTIKVPFSADITSSCPLCHGKRYKKHVLEIRYKEKSIFEVLELQVEEARLFFEGEEKLTAILQTLCEVGLGYLKLGQGIQTLSGGESQRVKLAKVLCKKSVGSVLYVLDEPTAGLHFSDIQQLLELLSTLTKAGHTVLIIEHNQQVIRNADWIIDLGPEGGENGGALVVQGTPETVSACENSYTGQFLKAHLKDS
ncbi:TrmO family methyltransferase [uncultured Enterococcus sp.]|uniref:TrmO family methyltransferase domain-containing protein n=1 Tax=uncultured Enterococcus sp. TaxID=167972 RepID=UPI002AA6D337|nr:TrmO family methyltransferase [uncultured Enterococcus sp.]